MGLPLTISKEKYDAILFDLDGVLTPTAKVHSKCWKRMFDDFLEYWTNEQRGSFPPFDIEADYLKYVDGKPRYDGVRSFLKSRGIELPDGEPKSPPGFDTVCALGNRKDSMFSEVLSADGVDPYPTSLDLIKELKQAEFKMAVVSSSKNCEAVLKAAQIEDYFDIRVDGKTAARLGIPGKPAPDTFIEAAKELGVPVERAIVIEDAISGVQAGRAGAFGLVIGIARHGDAAELKSHGADVVVSDLGELP